MSLDVLVVGGGSIGERHLRCFQQTDLCQMAICETLDERRGRLVEEYDVEGYASVQDAVQQKWDLVVIATPAHLHIDHALALSGTTKAVLIEKPLSTSLDQVEELQEGLNELKTGVAYVYRAHPAFKAVKEIIEDGRYGPVQEITIVSGQHFPTFRPAYREIYYTDRTTGGGAVQDAATHLFNLVSYLVGPFSRVYCDYDHQVLPGVDVEDTVHLTGRAGEGVMVNLSLNQFNAPNETVVQVNATEGSVRVNLHESRFGEMRLGEAEWSWSDVLIQERDELFRRQATATVEACQGEGEMLCSLDEAIHTLKVNLAAQESNGERVMRVG